MVQEIEEIIQKNLSAPQKEQEAESNPVQNSESAAINIGGGLGTIQDENDSCQDSDFSGDEEFIEQYGEEDLSKQAKEIIGEHLVAA